MDGHLGDQATAVRPPTRTSGAWPEAHTMVDFERIYRDHSPAVFGLARRICGDDGAEDITQEVFLRVWRHPERFDANRGSLRGYLLQMAHSAAVDQLRSSTARRKREERSDRLSRPDPQDVDVEALRTVGCDVVLAALNRLPVKRRDAIVTAFYGQCTYREAARVLGQPVGTVKSRIRDGLKELSSDLRMA